MDMEALVDWINEHYITFRKRFLLQHTDGNGYNTIHKTLHDGLIQAHLERKITIGVFAGRFITKFICFDIDAREGAETLTRALIDILVSKYGMSEKSVLLSASGSKGYHVELFFDEPIALSAAKKFYELVKADLEVTDNLIELRPTQQGVKLPLSIHRKTGAICHILDIETFKPLPLEALFDIEQIERGLFVEQLNEYWTYKPILITETQATAFEGVVDGMQLEIPIDYEERIQYTIESKLLLYPNTRHTMTLLLAIYFKDTGVAYEDTMRCIRDILHHSFDAQKNFYSSDTDKCFIDLEINRITTLVYERNYHIQQSSNKPLRFYKEDVLFTLTPKRIASQKLLFSLLCHAKRFATKDGVFYMSYAQMSAYGNANNRRILQTAINELEKSGLIEVVSRNEGKKNSPLARGDKKYLKAANRYRLNVTAPTDENERFLELEQVNVDDYTSYVANLMDSEELKALVGRNKYYRLYSQYYTA